jgi:hypothetical protein
LPGWLPEELTEEEHFRLTEAAEEGNAIGFIMRPVRPILRSKKIPGKILISLNDTNLSEFLAQKVVLCDKFSWNFF